MQRAAKTHRAALGGDGRVDMREVIDFVERCASVLERSDQADSAFYFEQIAEHLRRNPQKGFREDAGRILGI